MENKKFAKWCRAATSQIRFGPDRKQVYDELMAHLEDHRDALCEKEDMGFSAATDSALASMGDAEALAPQLAALHHPFWGYVYYFVKVVAIAVCVVTVWSCLHDFIRTAEFLWRYDDEKFGLTASNVIDSSTVNQDSSAYVDGNWFKVTRSLYYRDHEGRHVKFLISAISLHELNGNDAMLDHFWAVDSLGNYYASRADGQNTDSPRIISNQGRGLGYGTVRTMSIEGLPPEGRIEWIDLHYDRDGRDLVLRIELPKGV